MQKKFVLVCLIAAALGYVQLVISQTVDPNAPKNSGISVSTNVQSSMPLAQTQHSIALEQKQIQDKLDSFEKRTGDIKWAVTSVLSCMGFIITVVLAAVGFISWKSHKEYRESLNDIKEALKDAKEFARKTEEWEKKAQLAFKELDEKAQLAFEKINTKADEKLKELDEKAKEYLKELFDEAQNQRELSEKWNRAYKASIDAEYEAADKLWVEIIPQNPEDHMALNNWGNTLSDWARLGGPEAEDRFRQACEKYQRATDIKPDDHVAFTNWGAALSDWARMGGPEAEDRFRQACEKYQRATDIKPDLHEAFNNWGNALMSWANSGGSDTESLFDQAIEVLEKAEQLSEGCAAYNLACVWALRGDKEKCRYWLEKGQQKGSLVTREHAEYDDDLNGVKGEEWFKQIHWKNESNIKYES